MVERCNVVALGPDIGVHVDQAHVRVTTVLVVGQHRNLDHVRPQRPGHEGVEKWEKSLVKVVMP